MEDKRRSVLLNGAEVIENKRTEAMSGILVFMVMMGCAAVTLVIVWMGSWFYFQGKSASLVDELYQQINHPVSIANTQIAETNAALEATPYGLISDETREKVKTINTVLVRAGYLQSVIGTNVEITYQYGNYYANGALVDENGFDGTGYGSIDEPTPVDSLAISAETGEPISSGPNGAWAEPKDM